jgi:Uma2 family endonuclease
MSSSDEPLTAEQFLAGRGDLPDGGRWTELVAGRPIILSPPSLEHGTAVLNLSKLLAEFTQKEQAGYACFDLGLVVARDPDSARFPAISFFTTGPMFAEADRGVTETRPALVVEVASTNDRRRGLDERISSWLDWGVRAVWVLDTTARHVHSLEHGHPGRRLTEHETLLGGRVLSGFRASVGDLFKEPGWWK